MSDILEVTDENFDAEIVNSDVPAMVDFWAVWCGPCKMVGPIVEELADEYKGKIKVAKMDVDQNRATPGKFGIRNIPTLIFFREKGGWKFCKQEAHAADKKDVNNAEPSCFF